MTLSHLMNIIFTQEFAFSIFRLTTPILFAALAALITDRAGVMNIGLEGIMLFSALFGVIGSAYTQSVAAGLFCAILVGMLIALIMAYFSLQLKTDIILAGIAINLLASGGTVFILYALTKDKGLSSSLSSLTVPNLKLGIIEKIPGIGKIISGHSILTYFAFIAVGLIWLLLYRTSLGLRIRLVGENKEAAQSAGINVRRIQYYALLISGGLGALGGAYMSMSYMDMFSRDMTSGRGFIALAAEALGRGTPVGTMLSSLIFGAADALGNNLQAGDMPPEIIQLIPYVVTILGLLIYSIAHMRKVINKRKVKIATCK